MKEKRIQHTIRVIDGEGDGAGDGKREGEREVEWDRERGSGIQTRQLGVGREGSIDLKRGGGGGRRRCVNRRSQQERKGDRRSCTLPASWMMRHGRGSKEEESKGT